MLLVFRGYAAAACQAKGAIAVNSAGRRFVDESIPLALRLGLGRHRGRVGGGQVAPSRTSASQRLGGAALWHGLVHRGGVTSSRAARGPASGPLSPGFPGRAQLFGFVFYDSKPL